ncbi:MAG: hypothetical protein K8R53_14660, partial [Bacteroidales bacterium]|nr:hypothetical protein [Bacteroidales bacterium]
YIDDVEFVSGNYSMVNPQSWEEGYGNWYTEGGGWEIGEPSTGPGFANSGTNCIALNLDGNYGTFADCRLVSPPYVVPPATENPRLRFWNWHAIFEETSHYNDDDGYVQVREYGTANWTNVSQLYRGYGGNCWSKGGAELSAFAGKTIQIAFYLYSDYTQESLGWYIDNVEFVSGNYSIENPQSWEEGFGNWYTEGGGWEVGFPLYGPDTTHSGINCIGTNLDGNYGTFAECKLISSHFVVPDLIQFPRLRFWHWFQTENNDDICRIQVRKIGESNWTTIPGNFTGSSTTWTYGFPDLSAWANETVQVAFQIITDHNYSYPIWYIDDIFNEDNSMMTVDAGPDLIIEYGNSAQINASVSGGAAPLNIEWLPTTGLSNPSILNPIVTPAQSMDYILKVTDANNCFRTDIMKVVVWPFQLDIKLYLEGPFNGLEMGTALNNNNYIPLNQPFNTAPWNYSGSESVPSIPNPDIVDWVLLELREVNGDASQATGSTTIIRQAIFVNKNGQLVDLDGTSLLIFNLQVADNLYAVIWHRNHLGIMSGMPLNLNGITYSYDFTQAAGYTFGGNLGISKVADGIYGMTSGDGDSDGQIGNLDKNDIWIPQAGYSGYNPGDFSMDGQVNNSDKNDLWIPNSGSSTQVPD